MKKLLLLTALLFPCVSLASGPQVEIKNNRVIVKENGVRRDAGTVRSVERTNNGVQIKAQRGTRVTEVEIDRRGSISTTECNYSCQLLQESDEDE